MFARRELVYPAAVHSSVAALLAATLVAAAPAASGGGAPQAGATPAGAQAALDPEALARLPGEEVLDVVEGALAPPPNTVVRDTKYYGTVTIDHRAHLARRAPCKACHGPGPVQKMKFTPKIAHERCVGCHQAVAKGPDKCQGCHVQPPPPQLAAAEEKKPDAPPPPPEPNAANVAAALAAADARALAPDLREPFQRFLEVGFAQGRGPGVSVRVASHESHFVFTQSVDYQGSDTQTRTIAMLGAGASGLGRGRISFEAVGLAGADVVSRPGVGVLPALGARAGIEFRPNHGFVQRVCLAVTGVADLTHPAGRDPGWLTFYGTIATGFRVP
jgi:hypothetical protein